MSVANRAAPRILMSADAMGGVWTYAVDLAAGLAEFGVETTLVVFGPSPSRRQAARAQTIPGLTLVDSCLPLDWTAAEPAEVLECGAALRGLARAEDVDLIHLNSPALAAIGGFGAPVVGVCHSCLATWWSAVKDGPMPSDFRWRSQLMWQGMLACDLLAAPSESFAEAITRTYEIPRPFVVHNGRRPQPATPQEREPMVFTSGRLWDEGKNVGVLDRAAVAIGAPLHAAGPLHAPDGSGVQLKHVRPLGQLSSDEVAGWLARAPVYASSSLYEPFGLGVLEAAQAGCALVLSDIPTFRELWDGAALFAPADDPDAFARALDDLLADARRSERLGRQAAHRSVRYTIDTMAQGALQLYRSLRPELFTDLPQEAAA